MKVNVLKSDAPIKKKRQTLIQYGFKTNDDDGFRRRRKRTRANLKRREYFSSIDVARKRIGIEFYTVV